MAHYRLSALGDAHVEMVYELYRSNPDGSISTLDVTEVWRHGYGFIDEDLETNLGRADDTEFYARPDQGEDEACDFKESVAVYFEFSEDIDAAEQEDFKEKYHRGDAQGRGVLATSTRANMAGGSRTSGFGLRRRCASSFVRPMAPRCAR